MAHGADRAQRDLGIFYDEISASYRAVDEFRMKLLGLLPVATGTGVFLLLNGKIGDKAGSDTKTFLGAIGIVGFAFTLGLFAYELYGIKKCHSYILIGQWIETASKVPGQFVARPRDLGGLINEPFASSIIYPASLGAWAFTAMIFVSRTWASVLALVVFIVGFGLSLWITKAGSGNWDKELRGLLDERMKQPPSPAPEDWRSPEDVTQTS
jgi:hypothetical protein